MSTYTPLGSYFDAEMKATRPDMTVMMDYYLDMFNTFKAQGNQAGMNAAHEAGEALRATMGYSGGPDGSQYIPLSAPPQTYTPAPPAYTPPPAPSLPDYSDYYRDSGYSQLETQAQNLYDAQLRQATEALELQKRGVEQSADELARQAYIAYLRGQESLPQQLAALGYTGGLSETRQVELESGWQDRRNRIGLERATALLSIESAVNTAKSSGQIALANQLTGLHAQVQSQWNDYIRQMEQQSRDDAWRAYQSQYDSYWKGLQMETDSYWKQTQLDYSRAQDALSHLAKMQQQTYQQQRDAASDARYDTQQSYQQTKDNAAAEWQRLMFEYQKRQDEISNNIKQQQLILQQAEAARKAAGK